LNKAIIAVAMCAIITNQQCGGKDNFHQQSQLTPEEIKDQEEQKAKEEQYKQDEQKRKENGCVDWDTFISDAFNFNRSMAVQVIKDNIIIHDVAGEEMDYYDTCGGQFPYNSKNFGCSRRWYDRSGYSPIHYQYNYPKCTSDGLSVCSTVGGTRRFDTEEDFYNTCENWSYLVQSSTEFTDCICGLDNTVEYDNTPHGKMHIEIIKCKNYDITECKKRTCHTAWLFCE